MAAFEMSACQQVTLTANLAIKHLIKKKKKKRGEHEAEPDAEHPDHEKQAKVDGVPQWTVDNSDILCLSVPSDGMSCTVKGCGPAGSGNVIFSGKADFGEGIVPVYGSMEITITPGEDTVVVDLVAGEASAN